MRKSKKGMSALFKIVIVFIVIALFGGVLTRLVRRAGQTAIDVLPWDDGTGQQNQQASENFISIASAESSKGEPMELLTSGATENGDFDEIDCAAACWITLTFDRQITSFSNQHFTVKEKRGWASGWRAAEDINIVSVVKNEVVISGFEQEVQYLVSFSTTADYEEAGTKENFKLNTATAALRFETS